MSIVFTLYATVSHWLDKLNPLMKLFIRLWMGAVFFKSGIGKVQDWDTAVLLFTHEHPVPYLSPEFAAGSAITFEILCPILLAFGLFSRFAVLPMLVMTAVIEFTYLQHLQHQYWAILLSTILFVGPGKLSLDYVLERRIASHANSADKDGVYHAR
jgi:uncharacterized membrane protein YphA (DoxX/SURF4 family)